MMELPRHRCFSAPGRQAEMLPQREHQPKAVDNKAVHAEAIFISLRIRCEHQKDRCLQLT